MIKSILRLTNFSAEIRVGDHQWMVYSIKQPLLLNNNGSNAGVVHADQIIILNNLKIKVKICTTFV